MNTSSFPLKVALVAGEPSGDQLGAALMGALRDRHPEPVTFCGVGGEKMTEMGLSSLFDMNDIAVMGVSAVLGRLPTIMRRITETVRHILEEKPDLLVIIDSPDFTHRVAQQVKAVRPHLPVVNYVCPSVWAWRSHRARAMARYIDHVLALLSFEPTALSRLKGPPATFVGHPLGDVACEQKTRTLKNPGTLLLLPGSRSGEIKRHMPLLRASVDILLERMDEINLILPAVTRHRGLIEELLKDWRISPEIVSGDDEKIVCFKKADAALTASGTVSLELAAYRVPHVSVYSLDPLARPLRSFVGIWTANLPNLILDQPIIHEFVDEFARPQLIARHLQLLLSDSAQRQIQLDAFQEVADRLQLPEKQSPAQKAGDVVLDVWNRFQFYAR